MKLSAERNLCWFQLQGDCWPWPTFIPEHLHFPPIEHGPCAQLDFFPVFGHIRFLGVKRTGLPVGSVLDCPNMAIVLMRSPSRSNRIWGLNVFITALFAHGASYYTGMTATIETRLSFLIMHWDSAAARGQNCVNSLSTDKAHRNLLLRQTQVIRTRRLLEPLLIQ